MSKCYCQSEASCKLSAIQPNCNMVCIGGCPKPNCGLLKPQNKSTYGLNNGCKGQCTMEGPGGNLTCNSNKPCTSNDQCYPNYCVSGCLDKNPDPYSGQCQ